MFVGAQVDIFGKSTVLKQADLKTSEWNKFYASFLTEVSTNRDLESRADQYLMISDEEHFHRGVEEVWEKSTWSLGDTEPCGQPAGWSQSEKVDPVGDEAEAEDVRV